MFILIFFSFLKGKTAKCIKTKKGHEDRHCTRIKFYGSIGEDRDKKEGNKLIRFFKDFFSVLHIGYDGVRKVLLKIILFTYYQKAMGWRTLYQH